jgi:seryl-tRNA(Sec) selenium transferase
MGADLVIFSAGKDIGAPNDPGIIIGKRTLVEICRRLGPHNYENVDGGIRIYLGRPMKTSKEDIFAVIAALKKYLNMNENDRIANWENKVDYIISELSRNGLNKVRKIYPTDFGHPRPVCIPRVEIQPPENDKADNLLQKLREEDPPIYAYTFGNKLYINPQCVRDGEEKIIAERIIKIMQVKTGNH